MGFIVDKVSEDSFYENLLLGLPKLLEKSPFVSNLNLTRLNGVRQSDIRQWENNNSTILSEDLRCFYSSTNGFLYTYDFSYDYNADEGARIKHQGRIEINPLSDLVRIYGYETKNTAMIEPFGNTYKLSLSRDSKVFDLHIIDEHAKVVIVYLNNYSNPTVWLYSSSMAFSYLAEDFTTYFRMCIAHLGIPCWQYIVTREGLSDWAREIFLLLAPGVLYEDRNLIEVNTYNLGNVTNTIDPSIFLTQPSLAAKEKPVIQPAAQQPKEAKDKKGKAVGRRHISFRTGKSFMESKK
ncbi:unnamed protein product [Acanthoscelides obtectus]|nr:unnamed protein product [Acanthoscelides obtectus]CAK1653340.1 Tubulin polyglutamylase complex subunit 2 [Acanthoscelides obtectus]